MEQFAETLKAHLHEKGFIRVEQIIIERTPDWAGDDAIFVWLLLDDNLKSRDFTLQKLRPLDDEATRYTRATYPDLYVYVRMRRVKEWQEIVNA